MLKRIGISITTSLFIVIALSCKTDSKENLSAETVKFHVEDVEFNIQSKNLTYNRGISSTDVYLYWNKNQDRIKITEDFKVTPIREKERLKLNIPKDALFSGKSIYAGVGHIYYGIAQNDTTVAIYSLKTEDFVSTMNSSAEDIQYEKFKSLIFSEGEYTLE